MANRDVHFFMFNKSSVMISEFLSVSSLHKAKNPRASGGKSCEAYIKLHTRVNLHIHLFIFAMATVLMA